MAIILKDRVKETTDTTGTSDFVLAGSYAGFQTFSTIGANNYTYYCAVDPATGDWEVGVGQYTATAGGTLVRVTVMDNSLSSTSKISFSAGPKDVFITYPAKRAIFEEPNGNVLIDDGPITVVGAGVTSYTSFTAVLGEMYGNVNSYAQFYAQNYSDGSDASGDFVVYRNDALDDTSKFVDMGINSSLYNSLTYPIFSGGSAYVFNDGGEFFVGSATDDVVFFAGGVQTTDEAMRIDKTTKSLTTVSDVNVGGDLNATGGSFTAAVLTTSASVTSPANNEFVTKAYVDTATSTGIHIHTPVAADTSTALSAVYTQGGTTFNITDITGTNTVVTSAPHGLSIGDEIWLYSTAGNGLSTNTAYFVYSTPTTTSLQLSLTYGGTLLTGLTNASGLSYATRANSGVGAYLEASANAVLPIAGVIVGDRVLVYQQPTGYWNGVYVINSLGSVGSKWKLTRASDANKYEPQNTDGMGGGDYFFVQSNSESYVLTDPTGPIIIGYDAITYTLFSSVPAYTVTSPLQLVGTNLSLTTVPTTLGGTGTDTVATGDLLYGSGTNTWSKLSLGATYKVLVSDAGGIPQWGAVALNQSGSVSGSLPATNGGTGQSAYSTGDMIYSDATDSLAKLSGNTTTTKKFLGQTGTGSGSAAPAWQQPAASDITGLAPSATTDTTNASNISSGTLPSGRLSGSYTGVTGVGALTAGTWNADTVGPTYGGTGFASYAVGDILYANTTTSLAKLADVAVGNALISGGVGVAPSWGKVGLATHVSGTLPIANGGTNSTATPTAGGVPYGTGTAFAFTAAGTAGQVLVSNGAGAPTWGTGTPTGVILMYPSSTPPSGFLLCNGQAVSRTTYSALFAITGTAYGAGDGSTTFNVPNFIDRFGVGAGSSYAAGSTGGTANGTLGTHTHTFTSGIQSADHIHYYSGTSSGQSANHTHTDSGNTGGQNADHYHGFTIGTGYYNNTDVNLATATYAARGLRAQNTGYVSNDHSHYYSFTTSANSNDHTHTYSGGTSGMSVNHTHAGTTDSAGSSLTNANLPPYLGVYFVIKT